MILFADESSVQLLPNVVHTYSLVGHRPVLKWYKKSEKVYVISAIAPSGKMYYQTGGHRFKSAGIVRFLKHLLSRIPCKIHLIWDGSALHFSEKIKALLSTLKPGRLTLYKLPAHSPELNPDEQVWAYLKQESDLKNFAAKNFTELRERVIQHMEELKQKPQRIKAMFLHQDCGWEI